MNAPLKPRARRRLLPLSTGSEHSRADQERRPPTAELILRRVTYACGGKPTSSLKARHKRYLSRRACTVNSSSVTVSVRRSSSIARARATAALDLYVGERVWLDPRMEQASTCAHCNTSLTQRDSMCPVCQTPLPNVAQRLRRRRSADVSRALILSASWMALWSLFFLSSHLTSARFSWLLCTLEAFIFFRLWRTMQVARAAAR